MGKVIELSRRESQAVERALAQLVSEGWTVGDVVSGGPLTAGFLMRHILHGRQRGTLGPEAPVVLEDPKYLRPWEVRGVRTEGGQLVLDAWGD